LDGDSLAEIAVVGNEGIVGVSLFMGGESTPSRAVVQSARIGIRLNAQLMKTDDTIPLISSYGVGCLGTL